MAHGLYGRVAVVFDVTGLCCVDKDNKRATPRKTTGRWALLFASVIPLVLCQFYFYQCPNRYMYIEPVLVRLLYFYTPLPPQNKVKRTLATLDFYLYVHLYMHVIFAHVRHIDFIEMMNMFDGQVACKVYCE